MYNIAKNEWTCLPRLNDGTCAPGLIIMQDRYLYKLGGTSDIGKVEMLDLYEQKNWVAINTCNKFGRKHTINRCLLYPLPRADNNGAANSLNFDDEKFLVLGCHFARSEKPFIYDINKNKYKSFTDKEIFVDMYRSNDLVQF